MPSAISVYGRLRSYQAAQRVTLVARATLTVALAMSGLAALAGPSTGLGAAQLLAAVALLTRRLAPAGTLLAAAVALWAAATGSPRGPDLVVTLAAVPWLLVWDGGRLARRLVPGPAPLAGPTDLAAWDAFSHPSGRLRVVSRLAFTLGVAGCTAFALAARDRLPTEALQASTVAIAAAALATAVAWTLAGAHGRRQARRDRADRLGRRARSAGSWLRRP